MDRLSRSLLDFARIMETLDEQEVSFVSVTQQFNTTHSMGRLTLNILLSFAQFERELIAERTSDKMTAARRKGKWTGGMPVLGYDVHPDGGRIIFNEEEAARVRGIFRLYLEKRAMMPAVRELKRRAWHTKEWITRKGTLHRGKPFNKNRLYRLLTNPIYLGKVRCKGEVYEGETSGSACRRSSATTGGPAAPGFEIDTAPSSAGSSSAAAATCRWGTPTARRRTATATVTTSAARPRRTGGTPAPPSRSRRRRSSASWWTAYGASARTPLLYRHTLAQGRVHVFTGNLDVLIYRGDTLDYPGVAD